MNTRLSACCLLTTTALLLVSPASAQDGCATVEVRNVRAQTGHLMVAAYLNSDSYNKQPATSVRIAAGETTTSFKLCGLSGDTVAISMFQDLDSDGKMKTNLLGLPVEPWGASGRPGVMGPKWDTTKVPLDGAPIVVNLSI